MTRKYEGHISAALLSLELQIKTLLEGAGGEDALALLDAVSELNQSEQKLALGVFTKIVNNIKNGEQRLLTEGDLARKSFEETLYSEIINSMREAALAEASKKLSVVNGGKARAEVMPKAPISLCEARKARKMPNSPAKPVIN